MWTLKVPNIVVDTIFTDYDQAYNTARYIVNHTDGVKFVTIFYNNQLETIIIKFGYGLYNFDQFNNLEINNRISDFFILHQDGIDNFYIKKK